MYSSYTTLQRAQLAKQEYLDTQEVFLGVYAPGRNAALKASLQDQLHRKFLLTDSLRPEALGSAVGVLLVREDLFLMPTALSCFADALRSGADYVTSDAVFGYSGVTTLYHSQGFAACPGCALVSRELLRRCQAEARDPENPVELQPDMPALVFFWNVERLSVPAHTGVRIFVAHGFVAMAVACQRVARELRDPVVGKVHLLPGTCIEFG